MNSIPQNIRYLPHTLDTRYHAVKTYRNGNSVAFICRRYKISKASLMRPWRDSTGACTFVWDKLILNARRRSRARWTSPRPLS